MGTDNPEPDRMIPQAILCEAKKLDVKPVKPIVKNGVLQCHPTMKMAAEIGGLVVGEDWEKTNQALQLVAAEKSTEAMQIAETIANPYYKQQILDALAAID